MCVTRLPHNTGYTSSVLFAIEPKWVPYWLTIEWELKQSWCVFIENYWPLFNPDNGTRNSMRKPGFPNLVRLNRKRWGDGAAPACRACFRHVQHWVAGVGAIIGIDEEVPSSSPRPSPSLARTPQLASVGAPHASLHIQSSGQNYIKSVADTHIHCPNTVGGETAGASRAHDLPTRPLTTPVQCLYPHFKEVDGIGTSTMTDRQASSYTVIQPAIFGGQ